MAEFDRTRLYKNGQKRGVSTSVGTMKCASDGTLAIGDSALLFNIPKNSTIVQAFYVVRGAPTGGTQTIAIAVDGANVISAVATGTVQDAVKGGTTTRKFVSGQAPVTAVIGVADLVDGEIDIVVKYIENDLTTGELTEVS